MGEYPRQSGFEEAEATGTGSASSLEQVNQELSHFVSFVNAPGRSENDEQRSTEESGVFDKPKAAPNLELVFGGEGEGFFTELRKKENSVSLVDLAEGEFRPQPGDWLLEIKKITTDGSSSEPVGHEVWRVGSDRGQDLQIAMYLPTELLSQKIGLVSGFDYRYRVIPPAAVEGFVDEWKLSEAA